MPFVGQPYHKNNSSSSSSSSSLILRKATAAFEFSGSKEKIDHLSFMGDLKLYSRSDKGLDSLVQTVCVLVKI